MFVLMRALTYAAVFVGLFLVFMPASILSRTGVTMPESPGVPQVAGMFIAAAGAILVVWCVLGFALIGRGTPAPFDPPRRLVARGPYRFMRNPMYLGAALVLGGAALYFTSLALLGFTALFVLGAHLFAVKYEEPRLRRKFGDEYREYSSRVHRWRPTHPNDEESA